VQRHRPELNRLIVTLHSGEKHHMPAHSDKTNNIVRDSFVFDYSFGATRQLVFRRTDTDVHVHMVQLTNGSLFILGPVDNSLHKHEVPAPGAPCGPRASAIYRAINTFETEAGMRELRRQRAKTQAAHVTRDRAGTAKSRSAARHQRSG